MATAAQAKSLKRTDFLINDLTISVSRGGAGGSVFLPADTEETPPSPISPIASILVNIDYIDAVRQLVVDTIRNKRDFTSIGRAFVDGGADGDATVQLAIQEIGKAVVASAAFAAMSGRRGGEAGLVDPNCGGTSFETIPVTTSPVVHWGRKIHRVAELGRIREQLKVAVQGLDKAAAAAKPQGAEVGAVREALQGAISQLAH